MAAMRQWHKASYSAGAENCVEVAEGLTTAVRDTQHRELGILEVSASEWTALVGAVRSSN
jgi:hypothetical protein